MSLKGKLSEIVPRYARLPLISALILNMLTFFGTRPFTQGLAHHNMATAADAAIPFVPAFIFIYILAYFQWVAGYILIARESRELCFRFISGEMISKLMCLGFFVLFPTTMTRPDVTGSGLAASLTRFIYSTDSPDNLFPSIHCLESWLCFRGAVKLRRVGGWYKYASFVFTLLVFASTILVKQHCLVDVLGGVAVAELGQLIAGAARAERVFERAGRGQ